MYDSVLVPTDGSDAVGRTLEHALDLARRHDATVEALYVIDDRKLHTLPDEREREARETLERKAERAVDEVRMRAEERGLDTRMAIREGAPAEAIVTRAADSDVDVVAIGTRGGGDHEMAVQLGSTTRRVVENANVPVFVVHVGE